MAKIVIPEWLRLAAPNGKISAKEFAEILGISVHGLHKRVAHGSAPAPTDTLGGMKNEYTNKAVGVLKTFSRQTKAFWTVSDVKAYVRKLNAE